jgi:bacterioferritin-associated ferredoxin
MIVCVCNNVSDREIAGEVAAGCANFSQLQERTGVALACAACHDCARQTFNHHAQRPLVLDCPSHLSAGARVQELGRRLLPIRVSIAK